MNEKYLIYNEIKNEYERWINHEDIDEELKGELAEMEGKEDEITEAFRQGLKFGTSGLRGIIGAGTNRMNVHVVQRVTKGLANYINKTYNNPSVIISYDSRKNSNVFAITAAEVLSQNGIKVYIFKEMTPVSVLSFAIRDMKASMGVMITASHNPKEYNGYKVYNHHGYQILDEEAKKILDESEKISILGFTKKKEFEINYLDDTIKDKFISYSLKNWDFDYIISAEIKRNLNIIYTPLNGTGCNFMNEVLNKKGFINTHIVKNQEKPDENFTTCPIPNPELIEAYNEAFKLYDHINGDIILATDPDSDRIGVAYRVNGKKRVLTGNEMGILIFDFLLNYGNPKQGQIVFKSIVSSPLIEKMAETAGLQVINTLTGFKYIGQQISLLEAKNNLHKFFFAFEESNGYLSDPFVRDKDGITSGLLFAKMAALYKSNGVTFEKKLKEIYEKYGFEMDVTDNFYFKGHKGEARISKIMDYFRNSITHRIGPFKIKESTDFLEETGLPKSNVLMYDMENGQRFVIRPSGTELKIKIYYFGNNIEQLKNEIKKIIGFVQY